MSCNDISRVRCVSKCVKWNLVSLSLCVFCTFFFSKLQSFLQCPLEFDFVFWPRRAFHLRVFQPVKIYFLNHSLKSTLRWLSWALKRVLWVKIHDQHLKTNLVSLRAPHCYIEWNVLTLYKEGRKLPVKYIFCSMFMSMKLVNEVMCCF